MTGRTHDLAAVTALLWLAAAYPPGQLSLTTLLIALLANLIGGIAPDIDQPTAPFWRNLPIGSVAGRLVARAMGGHRFITHSLLGLALLAFGAHWLLVFLSPIMSGVDPHLVWLAFLVGAGSHLIMDMFTKEGVPLLLPIPIKFGLPPLRALRITTGHIVELYAVFPGLAALAIYIVSSHYHGLLELLHHHITS
ncbi:MAG TPA: metal-dependent hydrolase [Candidatus Saccharimonadia bacterium]|nr:metal-dependent hydrolase [Candidatus Saccharimonadia bacterium]